VLSLPATKQACSTKIGSFASPTNVFTPNIFSLSAFVERKFMAMDTASIIFLNVLGQAMFKIFVGRDNCRQLLTKQLTSYRQLAQIANKE